MTHVTVEFFDPSSPRGRTVGPWEWVHLEGRTLLGVTGDQRTAIATVGEDGLWVDETGAAWVDIAIKGGGL